MTFLMRNRPMTEIPASLIAFQRRFPDDDAGARRLVAVRWPNGFRCPACGHGRGWQLKTRKHSFECARCHRQTSVAAGTLLPHLDQTGTKCISSQIDFKPCNSLLKGIHWIYATKTCSDIARAFGGWIHPRGGGTIREIAIGIDQATSADGR